MAVCIYDPTVPCPGWICVERGCELVPLHVTPGPVNPSSRKEAMTDRPIGEPATVAEALSLARKLDAMDVVSQALVQHVSGGRAQMVFNGVVIDGPDLEPTELVFLLAGVTEADLAAAFQLAGRASCWLARGRPCGEIDPATREGIGTLDPDEIDGEEAIRRAREISGFDPERPVLE